MKQCLNIFVFLTFLLSGTACAFNTSEEKKFYKWVKNYTKLAKQEGISQKTINRFKKNATFIPKAIKLDRRQPYKTLTFNEYKEKIIPDYRAQTAANKIREYDKLFTEISEKYGVQKRFIAALWAIESNFGQNMGSFSIPNSLATLAYEGRRGEFFTKELTHALTIIDKKHIEFDKMKGSWAGAMGQTQFMPSSFLELAVDYDNDGKKDIWHTKADVFGSIANYLSKRGWDDETTWGREVKLPFMFKEKYIGKDTTKTLAQWKKLGVKKIDGSPLPNRPDLKASIIIPESSKDEAYIVYDNYKTILKWNRSLYFATAVGLLSDKIDRYLR